MDLVELGARVVAMAAGGAFVVVQAARFAAWWSSRVWGDEKATSFALQAAAYARPRGRRLERL